MLIGELFSLISLAAGLFFFIFAARYYFSIAFVMVRKNRIANRNNGLNNNNHWRNNNGNGNGNNGGSHNGTNNNGKTLHNGGTHLELFRNGSGEKAGKGVLTRLASWVRKVVFGNGVSYGNGGNGGNGSSRSLKNGNNNHRNNNHNNRQPFISIHLAFYNEKNVADRILTACTSLNYANYEVVVVDDSKDETVEILKKWQDDPRVKVIHREARKGWKGGALNEALKRMDPTAEYVMVFDADFIPPNDIIQQFLPYFSQGMGINGNNHNNHNNNGNGGLNNNHANNHPLNNHRTVNRNDYQRIIQKLEAWYEKRELAVVQGYQWHYLNAGENWLTKGIRAEYSSSYVIERTYQELTDAMKMISGSVFMIKADVLKKHGWSTSMTEDWELTVRLYLDGYKVVYTPYIQAPCECPSTIPQLVKQRMRWAEGHTYNAKKYFMEVIRSPKLSLMEKLEYAYYAPYYLQTFIFLIGTAFWFLSETMHQYLPFWTQVFGWSLLLSNFFSLPMMGLTGLFLEKNVQRDLTGIFSFIVMSYVLVPFMAYASLKGLLEKKERGTWIRTLKTGKITEIITKLELRKVWRELLPKRRKAKAVKKVLTKANGGMPTEETKDERSSDARDAQCGNDEGKLPERRLGPDTDQVGEENGLAEKMVKTTSGERKTKKLAFSHRLLRLTSGKKKFRIPLIIIIILFGVISGTFALSLTMPVAAIEAGGYYYVKYSASATNGRLSEIAASANSMSLVHSTTYYWFSEWAKNTGQDVSGSWVLTLEITGIGPSLKGGTLTVYLRSSNAQGSQGGQQLGSNTATIPQSAPATLPITITVAGGTTNTYAYIELDIVVPAGSGSHSLTIATDSSTGSRLQVPKTLVPENVFLLLVIAPLIPILIMRRSMNLPAFQKAKTQITKRN